MDNNPWNVSDADYSYLMTSRFLSWYQIVNGKQYRVEMSWDDPTTPHQLQRVQYTWTMSLTAEQIAQQEQQTNADINSGIQDLNNNINDLNSNINNVNNGINDINSFLNNDNYSPNDIVSSMPSVEFPNDIQAESMLSQLFDSFRNAFTNENSQDFVFVIPNSNGQSIQIPANYIETHLPNSVIVIIRVFYWGLICLYILKDVWRYIDKLRQGDHFLQSEHDIKTEVL